jgi:hypothetical protein
MGLMAVVSLPRAFVFRLDARDPHPVPWIRVKLSAAVQDGVIGADAPIMGEVGSSEWRTTLSQKYLDT